MLTLFMFNIYLPTENEFKDSEKIYVLCNSAKIEQRMHNSTHLLKVIELLIILDRKQVFSQN